jgi:hypothetical protein
MEKRCPGCGLTKPLDQWHKNRTNRDGLHVYCKSCRRLWANTPEQTDKRKTYMQQRSQTETFKANQRRYKQTDKGKQVYQSISKQCRERYPDRHLARYAVNHAVRGGRIPAASTLPCFRCGSAATEYHHFAGYEMEHWFDIDAVCRRCHAILRDP